MVGYVGLHTFITDQLKTSKIAIDCGSNHGDFARWLHENTPAKIYSFEPDPRLFNKLPEFDRVTYINKAIDGSSGSMKFALGEQNCSSGFYRESSDQSVIEVSKVSLEDFCKEQNIQHIDLLKIDIEGAELNVLEQSSDKFLQTVDQITVEFHDFLEPNDVPRIKAIFEKMKRIGFDTFCFSHYTYGDCLFVNRKAIAMNPFSKMLFVIKHKYIPGIIRRINRLFGKKV